MSLIFKAMKLKLGGLIMRKIWFSVFSIVIFLGLIMNNSILAEENSEISVNVDGENVSLQKIKVNVNGKKVESDVPAVNYRETL